MKNRNWTCLSNFILKIIAIVTMTIDHIGVILGENVGGNFWLAIVFRSIGRLALPLFCFLLVEGVLHTKRFGNYMLRLGIMATSITIAIIVVEYGFEGMSMRNDGNIFIDLLLGALFVFLIRKKQWYYKLLALVPIIIATLSFVVTCLETSEPLFIHWYPFFLRCQYHIYSVGMMALFYVAHILKDMYLNKYSNDSGIPKESLEGTSIERSALNLLSFGAVVIATLGLLVISFLLDTIYVFWMADIQNFAIISGAFILLYNGKRGYNAKWFQYGCYLYYPLHLLILYGIGSLL